MSWLLLGRRGNTAISELQRALVSHRIGLQAVYRHPLWGWRLPEGAELAIFCYPDQAPLAARLGSCRKVYYVQDDFRSYGYRPEQLLAWEQSLLLDTDLVIVVSRGLARRYRELFHGPILVAPLAVPDRFLPASPPPARTPRPLVGVLGRISSRLRLDWLRFALCALPWLRLVLVGDVEREEMLPGDYKHLHFLQRHPRCLFTGRRPFDRLFDYAATLDLALLPYSAHSVNPLGSAYRYFIHLPFGTTMLATPGVEQLEEFQPLVQLSPTLERWLQDLEALRAREFEDGRRQERWESARENTWSRRAAQILEAI